MKKGDIAKSLFVINSTHFLFPTPFVLRDPSGEVVALYKDGDDPDVFTIMAYAMSHLMTVGQVLDHFQTIWMKLLDTDHPNHDLYSRLVTFPGNMLIDDTVLFDDWPILSQETINALWQHGTEVEYHEEQDEANPVNPRTALIVKDSLAKGIKRLISEMEKGTLEVIYDESDEWQTNQLLKKAVLLYFRLHENKVSMGWDSFQPGSYDKVPLRFTNWNDEQFRESKLRICSGAIIRFGAYVGANTLIMSNAFINIAAYIGEGSYIGPNSTIEACVRIGKGVTIAAGAVIGDHLDDLDDLDVVGPVIEDGVYVGKNTSIGSGVIVRKGAIIGDGVHITANTPIIDNSGVRESGEIPTNAIVVSGVIQGVVCVRIIGYHLLEKTPVEALNNALLDVLARG